MNCFLKKDIYKHIAKINHSYAIILLFIILLFTINNCLADTIIINTFNELTSAMNTVRGHNYQNM